MLNIIITGLPATGKKTQSDKIARAFGLMHISTGELLRQEAGKDSENGKKVSGFLQEGKLVPDNLIMEIVMHQVKQQIDKAKGFVFDGFPRTPEQADALDQLLESHGTSVSVFFVLRADTENIITRMKLRNPGGTPDTAAIEQSILQQKSYLKGLETHYQKQYKLNYVDGHGTSDEVFDRLKKHVEELKM